MKRNLFAILLAVVLIAAMVFVIAPSAKADVSNIITLDENGAVTITEENKDKILDLKGYQGATVTFAVTAELQVIDSANTAKDGTTAGSMTIVNNEGVTGTVATVSFDGNVRYLAVNTENTYAFHPFNLAIVRKGVNVKQNSVSLEARFMANDVVARLITELGIYKHEGEKTQGCIPAKESFADGNYVTACYDLIGSLESDDAIQMTRNFSPYIKINGNETPILGAAKAISPVEILDSIGDSFMAGKFTGTSRTLALQLFNDRAALQNYMSAMKIFESNAKWDLTGQHDGIVTLPKRQGTADSITTVGSNYRDASFVVKELTPSKNEDGSLKQGNFSAQIAFIFSNGKKFEVRIHNTDGDGNYKLQTMAGINKVGSDNGWRWLADLTAAQKTKLMSDGVQFRVALVDHFAVILVDGVHMMTYDLTAEYANAGINANETAKVCFTMQGNTDTTNHEIAYTLGEEPAYAKVQVADGITNGTVKTDKIVKYLDSAAGRKDRTTQSVVLAGEKVTLTVSPNSGKYQKLYVNGEPLMLPWKSNKYSVVAEEGATYNITGSFVDGYKGGQADGNLWDYSNVAHGHLGIYYPNTTTTSWKTIDGDYNSWYMVLKDYSNGAESAAGNNTEGFIFRFEITVNGTGYQFRVIKQNGVYRLQEMQKWGGWKFDDAATSAILGDGVELRAERYSGNKIEFFVNGKSVYTYTMEGVTAENPVTKFAMWHDNNKGHYIDLPFKAEKTTLYVKNENVDLGDESNGNIVIPVHDNYAQVATRLNSYKEASVTIKDYIPSKDANGNLVKGDFSMQLALIFSDGKKFEVRLHNTDNDGKYRLQHMADGDKILTSWSSYGTLNNDQVAKLLSEGMKYTVKNTDAGVELYLDDVYIDTVDIGAYNGQAAQIRITLQGDKGVENIVIPFEVK